MKERVKVIPVRRPVTVELDNVLTIKKKGGKADGFSSMSIVVADSHTGDVMDLTTGLRIEKTGMHHMTSGSYLDRIEITEVDFKSLGVVLIWGADTGYERPVSTILFKSLESSRMTAHGFIRSDFKVEPFITHL